MPAKTNRRSSCDYSGQIEVIRVDALDLVDTLSCHSDAVFNRQVSQLKSAK